MDIFVKNYEHVNRAFNNWDTPKGKYIGCKRQYDEEMKRGSFVAYEEGLRISQQSSKNCEYKGLSIQAENVIRAASLFRDRKGNIKPSDRLIDGMKEVGVKFEVPDWLPSHYR